MNDGAAAQVRATRPDAKAPAASAPALPAVAVFAAPANWRTIELLSDLHLDAQMPATAAAFAARLHSTDADAVLVLGDLFEAWVGDDALALPGFTEPTRAIRAAVERGVAVGFMIGNRDFLVGRAWHVAAGAFALPDPTVVVAHGQRALLTHGDALCLADAAYQAFRAQSRDDAWQRALLARPLAERLQIAQAMRAASREHQAWMSAHADLDTAGVRAWLDGAQCSAMIHGHTHRPACHRDDLGRRRWVLSDWDFDAPPAAAGLPGDGAVPRADVLRWTAGGLARHAVGADGALGPAQCAQGDDRPS